MRWRRRPPPERAVDLDPPPIAARYVGYAELMRETPDAVFALDRDGRFTELNPATAHLSGYPLDEQLGMHFADLVVPGDLARVREIFSGGSARRAQQLELSIRRADGQVADLSVTGMTTYVDGEFRGVYAVARDVTAHRRVTRELETTRQLAAAAGRLRSDFVARMSHEIRTPLTGLLSAAELLAEAPAETERAALVATVRRCAERLSGVVEQALEAPGRDEEGPCETEAFDLHTLLLEVVGAHEGAAWVKGLHLQLDLDPLAPRHVRGYPTWTIRILDHLLARAVRSTDTGGIELSAELTASARLGSAVLYRVRDSGSTVATASRAGLEIVEQLVTITGGEVAVDSRLGVGTTVTVLMPLSLPAG